MAIHGYYTNYTRQSSKLHQKSHNTNIRAYSIDIRGITLWNSLGHDIISSTQHLSIKH